MSTTAQFLNTKIFPTLRLSQAGSQLVRSGNPWLKATHLLELLNTDSDLVFLSDPKGNFLGTALYAPGSRLPVRILSKAACDLDRHLLTTRMRQALQRRQSFFQASPWLELGKPDAYRIVHGEADQLPGLFIDCYGQSAVIQTATQAMNARKRDIAQILVENFEMKQVISRDDGSNRDLEKLPREKGVIYGNLNTQVSFHDAGSRMEADLLHDGKTGAFLDQQENHAWCLNHAFVKKGKALDVFTYHGGFALALARAGFMVSAGDENPVAIERAKKNASVNSLTIDFEVHNAFDWLRFLETEKQTFSVVVVDPPALAKRGLFSNPKASFDAARRAYKELNLRALRILEPEGILIACSCSGSISPAAFAEILAEASQDAGRAVQIIERRGAGHDHPSLLGIPETDHLKCFMLRVLPIS